MFESIIEDIKWKYKSGNTLIRIIMVNAGIFVFINLGELFVKGMLGAEAAITFTEFFMVSSNMFHNLTHPWVFITHMFLHQSFWHIFWNMVWLYTFGNIVGDLLSDKVVLPTYIMSGLFGAMVYIIFGNIPSPWEVGGFALGASAAVNGFLLLSASKFPNYVVNLLLLGPVKIKYIVAVFLLIDIIALGGSYNSGGHLAHLGGAFMGWYIVYLWDNKNIDLIEWANGIIQKVDNFFAGLLGRNVKPKMKVNYKSPKAEQGRRKRTSNRAERRKPSGHQEKLDAILDKIKETGYENLTAEEKEFLYNASKR